MRHLVRLLGALLVAAAVLGPVPAAADHSPAVHLHSPTPTGVTADPTPLLAISADGLGPDDRGGADITLTAPDGTTSYLSTRELRARTMVQLPEADALRAPGTYRVRLHASTRVWPQPVHEWTFEYRPDRTSRSRYHVPVASAAWDVEGENLLLHDLVGFPPPAGPATIVGEVYVDDLADLLDVDHSERLQLRGTLDTDRACGSGEGPWSLVHPGGDRIEGWWWWTPTCEAAGTFVLDVTGGTGRYAGVTGAGVWDVTGTNGVSGDWVVELSPG